MSIQRVQWCFAVLVLMALPPAAGAQATTTTAENALARIDSGKVIRARLDPERTVIGAYAPVGDGRLGIRTNQGGTETLRLSELRELSVRGRHTKTGAIIGGIAGAAFGTFVGLIAAAMCETDSCDGGEPLLIAIPVFGAGGALVGAAVGSAFPRWKRVYP